MSTWRQEALLRIAQLDPPANLYPERSIDGGGGKSGAGRIAFRSCLHDSGRAVIVPVSEMGGAASAPPTTLRMFQIQKSPGGGSATAARTALPTAAVPHAWPIRCCAWAGNALAVGSTNGRLAVLNVAPDDDFHAGDVAEQVEVTVPGVTALSELRVPPSAPASSSAVMDVQLRTDGATACIASASLHVYGTIGDPAPRFSASLNGGSVATCLDVAGDGAAVAVVGAVSGAVSVADTRTAGFTGLTCGVGATSSASRCSGRIVEDVRFNPVFKTLFTVARGDGSVQVFDTRLTSQPLASIIDATDGTATQSSFVPGSTDLLAVGGSDAIVRLWSLRNVSAPHLMDAVARAGDPVVSLFVGPEDDLDTATVVDRAGNVFVSRFSEEFLADVAPRPTAANAGLRKAAVHMYARRADAAAGCIEAALKAATEAGDVAAAAQATEMLEDLSLAVDPAYTDAVPSLTQESNPAEGDAIDSAQALWSRPHVVTTALLGYFEAHPSDATRDAFLPRLTLTRARRNSIAALEGEVAFVRALDASDAVALTKFVPQLGLAIAAARLEPSLLGGAVELLLGAQELGAVLELLDEAAAMCAGVDPLHRCTDKSLPHVRAILAALLEPLALEGHPESGGSASTFLEQRAVRDLHEAAAATELVSAWIRFDAGLSEADTFCSIVADYDADAGSRGACMAIPAPSLATAIVAAQLERHPEDLAGVVRLVELHGAAIGVPLDDLDDETAGAARELRDIALGAVEAHAEASDDVIRELQIIADGIHSPSTTQRLAAAGKLVDGVVTAVDWVEIALSVRARFGGGGGGGGGRGEAAALIAPIWDGNDPLLPLEGAVADVLDALAAVFGEVRGDRQLRPQVQEHVMRLGTAVEGLVTEFDIALDAPEGGMLNAVLEECADFVDADVE